MASESPLGDGGGGGGGVGKKPGIYQQFEVAGEI
jgi:hypothetical protein